MTGDPKTETEDTAPKPANGPKSETAEKPNAQADQKQAATAKKPRASQAKAKPASAPKKPAAKPKPRKPAAPKADPKPKPDPESGATADPKPKPEPKPAGKKFELAKFDYVGPPQSITFHAPDYEAVTVRCHPGKSVQIPKDHKITAGMIARKLLTDPTPKGGDETKQG